MTTGINEAGHTVFVIPSLNRTNSIGPGEESHSGLRATTSSLAESSALDVSYARRIVRSCAVRPVVASAEEGDMTTLIRVLEHVGLSN